MTDKKGSVHRFLFLCIFQIAFTKFSHQGKVGIAVQNKNRCTKTAKF